ncbi:hypothetical protein HYPSUDRAFT_52298 [Hypholoma sublateritium FD-334 SS-4]|uniref:Uncharacterized protein n=1 Tax=Hypholoma sublateritium (strain FD-334 SS-4) TaxID=945553 RepID=A0A0D2PE31_HYPSF|nr:hypothetical protein HYPSUDRAFT_52298 [Hypholoma sublateritium FD-334 SS-4]
MARRETRVHSAAKILRGDSRGACIILPGRCSLVFVYATWFPGYVVYMRKRCVGSYTLVEDRWGVRDALAYDASSERTALAWFANAGDPPGGWKLHHRARRESALRALGKGELDAMARGFPTLILLTSRGVVWPSIARVGIMGAWGQIKTSGEPRGGVW